MFLSTAIDSGIGLTAVKKNGKTIAFFLTCVVLLFYNYTALSYNSYDLYFKILNC
jgi:hypothetical protein